MRRARLLKNLVPVSVAGAALLVLPACAGHKELKAPCSASLAPSAYWSGSAFASVGCGPILKVNPLNGPVPAVSAIQEM